MVQDRNSVETAELSGREVRRVVALLRGAELDRRVIAPLSVMIPGMTDADGRRIRDAAVRAREADGDGIAALCAGEGDEMLVVSESMLAGSELVVPAGGDDLFVRVVAGSRVPADAVRRTVDGGTAGPMRGELVLGLLIVRHPFGGESAVDRADAIGANGGVLGLSLATSTSDIGESLSILRDDDLVGTGCVPSGEAAWNAALAGYAKAVHSCPPLADRLMGAGSYVSHPLGEPVLALTVGEAVALPPGSTVGVEVSGRRAVTVSCTNRPEPQVGDRK